MKQYEVRILQFISKTHHCTLNQLREEFGESGVVLAHDFFDKGYLLLDLDDTLLEAERIGPGNFYATTDLGETEITLYYAQKREQAKNHVISWGISFFTAIITTVITTWIIQSIL